MTAEKMHPQAVITLDPAGIKVELLNWTGVGGAMLDRMYMALVKTSQSHSASLVHADRLAQTKSAEAARIDAL